MSYSILEVSTGQQHRVRESVADLQKVYDAVGDAKVEALAFTLVRGEKISVNYDHFVSLANLLADREPS